MNEQTDKMEAYSVVLFKVRNILLNFLDLYKI